MRPGTWPAVRAVGVGAAALLVSVAAAALVLWCWAKRRTDLRLFPARRPSTAIHPPRGSAWLWRRWRKRF